jgi:NADPH:quinone reductase-like Zn-dependent oxidoreductase
MPCTVHSSREALCHGYHHSCLKRGCTLVTFGNTGGDAVLLGLRYVFGKSITIRGAYVGPKAAMPRLLKLFPDKLKTVVDSVFEFADAQKASKRPTPGSSSEISW